MTPRHRSIRSLWRGAVSITPLVLVRVSYAIHTEPAHALIFGAAAVIIVVTWSLNPVLGLAMLASPRDRVFLDDREQRSALAFLAFVVGGIGCFITSTAVNENVFIPVGFGFVLWAFAAGRVHWLEPVHERRAAGAAAIAVACAIGCGAAIALGSRTTAVGLDLVVFLSGIGAMWYVLIASRAR